MTKSTPFMLRIGHIDIQVIPLSDKLADKNGCFGMYDSDSYTIGIQESIQPARQIETLIHEITHAIFDIWKIPNKLSGEERICESIDWPLTKVFQDNIGLLATIALALGSPGRSIFDRES